MKLDFIGTVIDRVFLLRWAGVLHDIQLPGGLQPDQSLGLVPLLGSTSEDGRTVQRQQVFPIFCPRVASDDDSL